MTVDGEIASKSLAHCPWMLLDSGAIRRWRVIESLIMRAIVAAQRPVKTQLRVSAQRLKKYLLMWIEQKALCVHLMHNPFACWIWPPNCQTTGCSILFNNKKVYQAPNLPAGLEKISTGFCKAHPFSVNVFDGNDLFSSFSLHTKSPIMTQVQEISHSHTTKLYKILVSG